ncbi:MAG: flagellar basal body rod protein FlgB [Desulfobacterales bacterium]|nr:flagellar basal body rod protein FlgB [Desulfobacterales bacterium]
MKHSPIFDTTYQFLGKSMDVSARRHNLISSNISNVDTIGYKPIDLDFQKTLEKAIQKEPDDLTQTNKNHFTGMDPLSVTMDGTIHDDADAYHLDSVNIDTEMSNLVENHVKYRSSIEMLLRKVTILKHAIAEGGR